MLTQKELKKQLHYDPTTGVFTRKLKAARRTKVGEVAGGKTRKGYVAIRVNGGRYEAHRLAFLYMEGYLPEHDVDHRNRIKGDTRWKNLRHATRTCNNQNKNIQRNNTSGFTGVTFKKRANKWVARVRLNRKTIELGYHSTRIDAALARYTFERQCPKWKCSYKSELVRAIKEEWPEFNHKGIN